MAFSFSFSRKLFLLAFLFLFSWGAGLPAPAQDTGTNTNTSGSTNYQNAPVNTILDLYEQLSGKHLIRDVNLNTVQPISLNATGLSKTDMLKMIETDLLLNGVAIVPVDDKTEKVVATPSQGKNPRSEGVK